MSDVLIGVIVVLIIAIIVGGATYSCSAMSVRYYEMANQCVERGGTFVPQGQGQWTGTCVSGKSP